MARSRNQRFRAIKGKSDHTKLRRAKERKAVRAKLRTKKSPHLKDRDLRMTIASRIKTEKIVRSRGFPSSSAWTDCPIWPESSHWEGSRDPTMNIHIKGTHKAAEVPRSLAGSKRNSATRRMSQRNSAKEGGIVSVCPKGAGE